MLFTSREWWSTCARLHWQERAGWLGAGLRDGYHPVTNVGNLVVCTEKSLSSLNVGRETKISVGNVGLLQQGTQNSCSHFISVLN